MTVVAIWRGQDSIVCGADTRISGSVGAITNSAAKILPLTVTTHTTSVASGKWEALESRTFGFAFAAQSTLAAFSSYALASTMASMVGLKNGRTAFPSMQTIAEIVRHAGQLYAPEIGGGFEAVVFGHDVPSNELRVFKVGPEAGISPFQMKAELVSLPEDGKPLIFGAGRARLLKVMADIEGSSPVPFLTFKPNVIDALWKLIKDEQNDSVGGYIQIAEASSAGFGYVTILEQEFEGSDKAKVKLLGHPLPILDESDFQIGTRGIAPEFLSFDRIIHDARPKAGGE